jgi:site-specific recombinase XerD
MTKQETTLGSIIQRFFMERLMRQQNASSNTIASYRDMWRLFLHYLNERRKMDLAEISLRHLTAELVLDFLDYLETERKCSIRSRNQRLAALKSFFHFAVFVEPYRLDEAQRVLHLPLKRYVRETVGYLEKPEMDAILSVPDRTTPEGRKLYALLLFMYNTGARVSEIAVVQTDDLKNAGGKRHVLIRAKNSKSKKDRLVPLRNVTAKVLDDLIVEQSDRDSFGQSPPQLFLNARGKQLTRSGISYLLAMATKKAADECVSLKNRKVTPHVIRHTTAMHLLQSGKDLNLVRLWLGHVKLNTTHQYAESNLEMKRSVLTDGGVFTATANPSYRPTAAILEFLDDLT